MVIKQELTLQPSMRSEFCLHASGKQEFLVTLRTLLATRSGASGLAKMPVVYYTASIYNGCFEKKIREN